MIDALVERLSHLVVIEIVGIDTEAFGAAFAVVFADALDGVFATAPAAARSEGEQGERLTGGAKVPDFALGDTLRVNVKVVEGNRERIQAFEGVCIARKNGDGIAGSFTVRKISFGEGVERVFPLHSTNIDSITVVRRGRVRRAKLYYLRSRRGKSARIAEDTHYKPKAEA